MAEWISFAKNDLIKSFSCLHNYILCQQKKKNVAFFHSVAPHIDESGQPANSRAKRKKPAENEIQKIRQIEWLYLWLQQFIKFWA